MSGTTARPSGRFRRKLLFSAVALLLSLVLAEGGLRLVLPVARRVSLPNDMIQSHLDGAAYRYDPDLGWYWPDPGVGGSPVNLYGFVRSTPMTREKPHGVRRVITFGDSQTFGAGMPPEKTYSARAEAALGPGWEILNAGISGYRSLNVLRLLKLKMLAFQPDAIVVDCMPFDSPRDDGSLAGAAIGATPIDRLRGLLWHSRLYYSLRLGMEVANPWRARWLDDTHAVENARGLDAPPGGGEGLGADDPRRALGNHALIQAWGERYGVTVFFMQYAVMDEDNAHGCMTGPGELPEGARVIPVCERLAATGIPAPRLFQDRNHLTEEGNALVGGFVADALREWAAGP